MEVSAPPLETRSAEVREQSINRIKATNLQDLRGPSGVIRSGQEGLTPDWDYKKRKQQVEAEDEATRKRLPGRNPGV